MRKDTNILAYLLLSAILILSLGLFSCKDSSTGSMTEPTQTLATNPHLMTDGMVFEIDNNCPAVIDSIGIGMSGTRQDLSVNANSQVIFTVESDVTSMSMYGQQIFPNTVTIITLPNGTKVKVTWTGNIVVVDTLTIM